ncbi:hypothetical protein PFISCL1PPCAC_350, partial [Pristionchus fissidentatus]
LLATLVLLQLLQPAAACPEHSACLFFGRCVVSGANDSIIVETGLRQFQERKNEECEKLMEYTEFKIRPFGNHRWNFTLEYADDSIDIHLSDLLLLSAKDAGATFFPGTNTSSKVIKFDKIDASNGALTARQFKVDYFEKNLFDVLADSTVIFRSNSDGLNDTSNQPQFWQALHDLIPCDAAEIIDDCTDQPKGTNCTMPVVHNDDVTCAEGQNLWMKTAASKWLKVHNITCDDATKDWRFHNGTGAANLALDSAEIQCATEEPAPWEASASSLKADAKVVEEKKKKRDGGGFSIMDSPYTWVGLGLVGLIALVVVIVAAVFAGRGIANKQRGGKSQRSRMEGGFKRLPQDPQPGDCGAGVSSSSGSEIDLRKVDGVAAAQERAETDVVAPLPAPAPSKMAQSVGEKTDVSSIKTYKETSDIKPVPAIPFSA